MRVFWTVGARRRLAEIETYVATQASPEIAREMIVRILRHVRMLAEPPLLGRRLTQYGTADVRELYERPYRIVFRVKDDRIDILTLMHNRQLLPSDLTDLEARG